jgi:hypothetical protein
MLGIQVEQCVFKYMFIAILNCSSFLSPIIIDTRYRLDNLDTSQQAVF